MSPRYARRTAESLGYRVIAIGEAIVGEASQSAATFVEVASRHSAVASTPGEGTEVELSLKKVQLP